jgi:pyruvate kinase
MSNFVNPFYPNIADNPACKLRKCKIIATIGSSCHTYEEIKALALAGADCFRINGRYVKFHSINIDEVVQTIRQVAAEIHKPLPIMLNLREGDLSIGV